MLALALPTVLADCKLAPSACYIDDGKRILNSDHYDGGLSREYCAQYCSDKGFQLAGVESGRECYCGNALRGDAKLATNASECDFKCSGKDAQSETCGGYWRLDVFKFSCSGTPVPQPRTPDFINNPCLNKSSVFASQPWCDASLSIDERVDDMVSRLTLEEKIGALDTSAPPLPSLGLNAYNWWSEATHGISHVRNDQTTPYESNFAFPITTAMSFNRSLWKLTGEQIGREGRAFMNVGNAWSTYWAPVVNLAREPRWGRNIETPGEDPYLSGEYATAFVRGFQEAPEAPGQLMASACCKHYVANEMEHSTVSGETWTRHDFDAPVPGLRRKGQSLVPHVQLHCRQRQAFVRERLAAQDGGARRVGLRRVHHLRLRRRERRVQPAPLCKDPRGDCEGCPRGRDGRRLHDLHWAARAVGARSEADQRRRHRRTAAHALPRAHAALAL